jgi:hypothetical protein
MANVYTYQALIDTNKRALIKLTGQIDTEMSNVTSIDVSNLAFALNANGYIMTSNVDPKPSYNVTIKRFFGDVNVNGLFKLQWQGDSNNDILVLGPAYYDIDLENGINAVIGNNAANTNGDILISTVGATANNSYTIFIDLRKDSLDYDAGQTADPVAFNRGF